MPSPGLRSARFSAEPAWIGRRSENRANESFQREIELHNDVVGPTSEAKTRAEAVLQSLQQLSLNNRENIMLLPAQRIVIVNQANATLEFDARRNLVADATSDFRQAIELTKGRSVSGRRKR